MDQGQQVQEDELLMDLGEHLYHLIDGVRIPGNDPHEIPRPRLPYLRYRPVQNNPAQLPALPPPAQQQQQLPMQPQQQRHRQRRYGIRNLYRNGHLRLMWDPIAPVPPPSPPPADSDSEIEEEDYDFLSESTTPSSSPSTTPTASQSSEDMSMTDDGSDISIDLVGPSCSTSSKLSRQPATPKPPRPIYKFRPFKLIKRHYKLRNRFQDFPLARSGHRIVATESNLYSLGGYNPHAAEVAARRGECLLFRELWVYNFATNTWSLAVTGRTAPTMPRELASNALISHMNVLLFHGGTGYPFGQTCSNDCYVITTQKQPVIRRLNATGDMPAAQYGPGIIVHGDYLYTIGGTTGFDYSCDVYRLHLLTLVWENVYISRPEMREDPEGRYRHEVVYDGYYIYVLGGGTSQSVYDLQRLPAFDLKLNRWIFVDTLPDRSISVIVDEDDNDAVGYPKPRKCFSCVQHIADNGDVEAFITGGLQGDFANYFADIWKLNLRTKQWTLLQTKLPKPLYFHSATNSGTGCMYVFGGIEYNEKEMRRRNDLYKMWMTIPKLSEICWDAITYYNERLDNYDPELLLKVGIPLRFINRIGGSFIRNTSKHSREMSQISKIAMDPKRFRSQSQ